MIGDLHGNHSGVPRSYLLSSCPAAVLVTFLQGNHFTVQVSGTACLTQTNTHTSGCPVRRCRRRTCVTPLLATPLMLPSKPSPPKAWPTIPPHFVPAFTRQDIKISTYRSAPLLFGHGQMQGVCFMSTIGLDLMSCIIHPSPSLGAWYVHLPSGISGIMSDQIFTPPVEIGQVLPVYYENQPSCQSNMSW